MFKSIVSLLMVCVVLLQGYANAAMLSCENHSPYTAQVNALQVVGDSEDGQHATMPGHAAHNHHVHVHDGAHHAAGKCGSCFGCCTGLAIITSAHAILPPLPRMWELISFTQQFLPSVIPDYLERPPQSLSV